VKQNVITAKIAVNDVSSNRGKTPKNAKNYFDKKAPAGLSGHQGPYPCQDP
jgi:hypothetical protein